MKLSAHLDKGFWALADRGLPFIYGAAQIALARVLGLSEYGTLFIFQVIFNMLFSFTDNFALQAIVKYGVEPEIDLGALITATSTIFLGFLLPILLIINLFPHAIASVLGNTQLASLFPLLAVYVLVSSPRVVFSKILQMRFRMKDIFWVDLANFGLGGLLLGVGLYQHQIHYADDVVWRMVVAGVASSLLALWLGRKVDRIRLALSRSMFVRIRDFVRYQAATGLVSVIQQNIDSLAVSTFTGAAGAGAYGGAKNLYRIFDVMRDTVTLLVYPSTSKYYARGEHGTVRTILEKAIGFLYLGLIPLIIILFIASPFVFHLLFGPKFDTSIPIFRVLIVGSIVLPIQMVFISTMVGMARVKEMFRIISIGLGAALVLTFTLLPTIGIMGAAIAFIVGNTIQATLSYRFVRSEIDIRLRHIGPKTIDDARQFLRAKLLFRASDQ